MKNLLFSWEDDDGEHQVELPARFEVCSRCEGHGSHLNPSIGEHAYSVEEFCDSFDEEERQQYFTRGGIYDVICEECQGQRVISVVDESQLTAEQKAVFGRYTKYQEAKAKDDAIWRAEVAAERAMGC